ncbi:TetR/AcrR family transcriptional regulator [Rhodococcus sp. D2-41]|uniref:TetR family transcriptional regulator n=1 Tax=Speluncibacter jeojiensis TaxID=2710754 RepID=A0A9X4M4B4_9ACTN|nr:TetR family transcriptional regulator [Rhodococcus sp. D2-41]MDG3011657.1 TetR/AcrR family transcriptional regulator [Rhodococcus sp. D2-41]MDG3014988.1 TetR family transcriptional regulator [Corynebacteriales bacterium D3-21]
MARLAVAREAAEPSSKLQRQKYVRMLDAATDLGSQYEFDQVQMLDVAKSAGVAIGTLYRYFPSKHHLFVGVLTRQIDAMGDRLAQVGRRCESPLEATVFVLDHALHQMLRRPRLSISMITAAYTARAVGTVPVDRIDDSFRDVLIAATRLDPPTDLDLTLLRLVVQQWFAIVQSCLYGALDVEQAEADTALACQLLLARLSTVRGLTH